VAIEGAGLRGDVAEAEDRARNLLEATGAEILIWGEVVQELRTYSLRLTSSVSNRFTRYAFEDLRFGEPLLRDLAPLVLGAALAEAGDVDFARATAPALGPLVDRLAPLAENPPAALSAEQVRDLRIAYAKVATEYGAIAEGQERLARVVEMLDRVLEATSRQDEPRPWASIQKTRAYTLRQWGEMGPTQALRKAVAAEKAALEIYSREDDPMDWARTQLDLGICYSLLNERVEEGSAQAAAEAFSAALEILTREETPLDWADAQLNLGKALYDAGQRGEVGALEASVAAYRRALTVHTRERRPKVWARTMSNLGNALQQLGMRTSDEARLEASVDAYRAALSVLTRDAAPLDWAVIQNNLANTFVALADYGRSDALDEALAAYQAALTVHTRDNAPMDWAIAVGNLAVIERRLGVDRDMARRIKEAITLHRSAMEVESREASPAGWAWHQKEMGKCYLALAERGEDGALDQALSAFDASLSVYGEGDYGWAMSHSFRAVALTLKARRTGDPAPAREAVERLDEAIAILDPVSDQAAAEARQRRTRAATLLDELNAR
jgi:tetratricopeptide (TPR) repeat protein